MTQCYKGGHDFPYEDETGAYCEEHGVTFIWKRPPPASRPPAPPTPDPDDVASGDTRSPASSMSKEPDRSGAGGRWPPP